MDDDLGAKAPVTRLRRRMSVEAEDSPLPTTPSTPTKKRTTRLAAKPQLELIDELAAENVLKRTTRKAAVKENVEADPNSGTPTPVTPSRRSTRIRSNTSILSETTAQNVESPRAKRALRRTSQLGSDTESAAVTPARQTRRTRKDSTASVDKQGSDTESAAVTPAKQTRQTRTESTTSVDKQAGAGDEKVVVYIVTSTNAADPGKETPKDSTNGTDNQSPSTRKSPRLQNKKGVKVDVETDTAKKDTDKSLNEAQNNDKASPAKNNHLENKENNEATSPKLNETEKEKLSTSSNNIINEIQNKKNKALNKSTSAIEKIASDLKNKGNNTKSWTTLSSPPSNIGSVSDNDEMTEKPMDNKTSISDSGDGLQTSKTNENLAESCIKSPIKSFDDLIDANDILVSQDQVAEIERHKNDTVKLFENAPNHQQPLVLIEDSDSCSVGKLSIDTQIDGEDQCVPVVTNPSKNESPDKCEQSVEPMDIDESMPTNVTIDDFSDKSNTSKDDLEVPVQKTDEDDESKRKSSISIQTVVGEYKNDSLNKSKNSSTLTNGISSTLVQENVSDSTKYKPQRSFSFSQVDNEKDSNEARMSLDKSQRKSFISINEENVEKLNESNKSKRKSSISQNNSEINQNVNEPRKSLDKSERILSIAIAREDKEKLNESQNKSNRKSSISHNNSAYIQNNNESKKFLEKSQRKSSISIGVDNAEQPNESSNKKRKSSISQTDPEMKSKSSSLVSQTDSQIEQSGNKNKITLNISQLKDVSTNSSNNVMSPNVTNNELSKSLNGPDVKNKRIDKKNRSLNYLTSTPIQEKPLQKLTMQINTSIISPAVENNNNNTKEKSPKKNALKQSFDSDSSDETDEEIKFKNKKDSFGAFNQFSRAPSSLESSDDESDTESKNQIKIAVKKSPNTKVSALESSDSDEESDSNGQQNNNKTPNKKIDSPESEAKTVKIRKKVPVRESSDSDEESDSTSQQNKRTPNKKLINQSKSGEPKIIKAHNKKPPISDKSDTSIDSDSDEEVSKDRSKMVDDEASEASDDYESGDSQSEKDRRYEAEHEIVEKGETLDSEEEYSNDSEYEKDSFLVSSEAEDNEILSGTGDDLSLSDNELSMSAKSKNKFNERKLKQQKKTSREMYEARHKNNESTNSTKSETAKSNKSKRQRLESSTLESENENTQPKKSNRLRINSSQDSSLDNSDPDESIRIKKKKPKRLSESVHDIITNEKEITVLNESTAEKTDPLSVAIKQEPKTPRKPFNMSTVTINDKIEEIQVDSNTSLIKQNNSSDPLQASMMADDADDSSSSDNMEIIDNYDAILSNLNMQANKIKTVDTSLNFNKKSKVSKDPMIDQLNLTQTKKSKKNKNKKTEDKSTESFKSAKETSKVGKENEDSSDSIDMKLLFPEDSNDSEVNASQFKPKFNDEPTEKCIPLKRTEGQTHIPGNMDMNTSVSNLSKKNKKRNSSHCEPKDVPSNTEKSDDNDIKIVIDTTGAHQEFDTLMAQTSSSKKKKNKKNDINEEPNGNDIKIVIDTTATREEFDTSMAQTSSSKKKKNKKNDFTEEPNDNDIKIVIDTTGTREELDTTVAQTSSSKKNKNKKNDFTEQPNDDIKIVIDTTGTREELDTSMGQTSSSKKKKNKKNDFTEEPNDNDVKIVIDTTGTHEELGSSIAQTNSSKKNKNKKNKSLNEESIISESAVEVDCTDGVETRVETSLTSDQKKKKNKNKSFGFDVSINNENSFTLTEPHTEKKSRKKSGTTSELADTHIENTDKTVEEIPVNISIKSDKKKNKNKNDVSQNLEPEPVVEATHSLKKKSKSSISVEDVVLETQNMDSTEIPADTSIKSKKKKKKTKQNLEVSQTIVDNAGDDSDDAPMEMSYKSEKKSDATDAVTDDAVTSSEKKKHKKNKKKKKKNKNLSQSMEKSDDNVKITEQNGDASEKRKRKASDPPSLNVSNSISTQSLNSHKKKKRKILGDEFIAAYDEIEQKNRNEGSSNKTKQNKKTKYHDDGQAEVPQHKTKKRKNRDDDNEDKIHKVSKQNSFDKIHVPKLPKSVINQLTEKPQNKIVQNKVNKKKMAITAIATMPFVVEEAERRKNKPSKYLEQSICINYSPVKTKQKCFKDKHKVLPFTPTALTSDSGYTSKFNINVLPGQMQFVAQASNVENFRESFLGNQRIKKLGTFERCKIHRSQKISKF